MFEEEDLLPISGLQHLSFCERRWALVHIEGQWEENRFTAEGRVLHEHVHDGGFERRPGVFTSRGLPVRSLRLGLSGIADVVEFLDGESPFPIEYKRGKAKRESSFAVQLCAQALCLEEMLNVRISAGALYHGLTRRRQEVRFDARLREETEALVRRMHELWAAVVTPPPQYSKKCESCSLYNRCLPRVVSKGVERYWARALREISEAET